MALGILLAFAFLLTWQDYGPKEQSVSSQQNEDLVNFCEGSKL